MAPRSIWIPGSDHGLVWSGGVALLDGSVTPEVVERMWLQLQAGADLPGFLEGLSEACGSGLLGLPGFAIGLVSDQRMHLAVRGDFCAVVADGVEQTRIEGAGVTTWTERLIDGGEEITVSRLGVTPEPGLILVGGVVPAGMLVWRKNAAQGPGRRDRVEGSAPAPAKQPPRERTESAHAPAKPTEAASRTPADTAARPPRLVPDHAGEDASAAERVVAPAGSPAAPEMTPLAASEKAPAAAFAPTPSQHEPASAGDVWDPASFEAMWDRTLAGSVEAAAVRRREDDAASSPPAPPADLPPQTLEQEPSQPATANPPGAPEPDGDVFISAIPRHYPPPPPHRTPHSAPVAPAEGDHDGETVMRDELTGSSGGTSDTDEGEVLASFCSDRHPNPPQSPVCRICGASVAAATQRIAQPSIGRLLVSTGEQADLTGPVIFGRNPRATRFQGKRVPRLVSLPFAHVSGSHLELRVEGWSLLATDLQSTNGTFLRRGDKPPQRLPDTPVPLYRGDVIDFGDDVRVTFEFLS